MKIQESNIRYDQRYKTLEVVRKCGSYTAAGAILSLTTSAVAQQIRSIEHELGVKLFTYNRRHLKPTGECDLIADYVLRIQQMQNRMGDALSGRQSGRTRLVVGTTPSIEESAFPSVLACYQANHRDVQITVKSGSNAELSSLLENRLLDFAVVEGDFGAENANFILLDTDHLVIAVSNDSPYASADSITIEQLRKEHLVMRPQSSSTRSLFEANLKKRGLSIRDFRVMMEVESVAVIKKLVAENYGVSVLSYRACIQDAAHGMFKILPLKGMPMIRDIQLFYLRDYFDEDVLLEIRNTYEKMPAPDLA